jgi:predicted lysophospholipase L1 biosynthesis ABC-type transport system permease subunit
LVALAIGTIAAWAVITFLWRAQFIFFPSIAFLTILGSITIAFVCGLLINHRILAQKPAPFLRALAVQ